MGIFGGARPGWVDYDLSENRARARLPVGVVLARRIKTVGKAQACGTAMAVEAQELRGILGFLLVLSAVFAAARLFQLFPLLLILLALLPFSDDLQGNTGGDVSTPKEIRTSNWK